MQKNDKFLHVAHKLKFKAVFNFLLLKNKYLSPAVPKVAECKKFRNFNHFMYFRVNIFFLFSFREWCGSVVASTSSPATPATPCLVLSRLVGIVYRHHRHHIYTLFLRLNSAIKGKKKFKSFVGSQ